MCCIQFIANIATALFNKFIFRETFWSTSTWLVGIIELKVSESYIWSSHKAKIVYMSEIDEVRLFSREGFHSGKIFTNPQEH